MYQNDKFEDDPLRVFSTNQVQVHHGVSHVELQTGRRRGGRGADPVN